jgi:hypothetical protein
MRCAKSPVAISKPSAGHHHAIQSERSHLGARKARLDHGLNERRALGDARCAARVSCPFGVHHAGRRRRRRRRRRCRCCCCCSCACGCMAGLGRRQRRWRGQRRRRRRWWWRRRWWRCCK